MNTVFKWFCQNSILRSVLGVEGLRGTKLPEVGLVKCKVAVCSMLNMSCSSKSQQNSSKICLMGSKTRPQSKTSKNKYWHAYSKWSWMEVCLLWSQTFRKCVCFDVYSQQLDGTMFKLFLFSVSSFLDTILVPSFACSGTSQLGILGRCFRVANICC